MIDLIHEYAQMDAGWGTERALASGVSPRALNLCGHVADTYAHIDGDTFSPDPRADKRLIVLPLYEGVIPSLMSDESVDEEEIFLSDLIGWLPDSPGRWYFRLKSDPIAMLGRSNLHAAKVEQLSPTRWTMPITVYSNPLAWLRAGGDGVCPLTVRSMRQLLGLKQIFVPDPKYAIRLDTELRKPCPMIPEILIPKEARTHVHA